MLIEKYKARKISEIYGQDLAITMLKRFVINFYKGKKAVLLYGPSGSGKTSLAYALANSLDFEVFELNASHFRKRYDVERILQEAAEQKSIFAKFKILLVDEIDGISGDDRGGIQALIDLVEKTKYPIIFTANNPWEQKFNLLRQRCELIKLNELDYKIVTKILNDITKKENFKINQDILTTIAIRSQGDVRAAINDLEIFSRADFKKVDERVFGKRDREEDIFDVLQLIFKNYKVNGKVLNAFDNLTMELDRVLLWIDENLPLEYEKEELAEAYDKLSKADVFRGRIIRRQYWRFLVYENILLSAGILVSKKKTKEKFTFYKKPSRILKIWMNNQKKAKEKELIKKIAASTHSSIKKTAKNFPLLLMVLKKNEKLREELKLNKEEISLIIKGRKED